MKSEEMIVYLPWVDDIIYIEKYDGYTISTTKGNKQKIIENTLDELEKQLPKNKFFRVHKSFIVNLNEVSEIIQSGKTQLAILKNKKAIPISKRRNRLLLCKLQEESTII